MRLALSNERSATRARTAIRAHSFILSNLGPVSRRPVLRHVRRESAFEGSRHGSPALLMPLFDQCLWGDRPERSRRRPPRLPATVPGNAVGDRRLCHHCPQPPFFRRPARPPIQSAGRRPPIGVAPRRRRKLPWQEACANVLVWSDRHATNGGLPDARFLSLRPGSAMAAQQAKSPCRCA